VQITAWSVRFLAAKEKKGFLGEISKDNQERNE